MLRNTPISETHAAALSRVLTNVPRGYTRYSSGTIRADRAYDLAQKFHQIHHIGASPSQRHTRKKKGKANAVLVMFKPPKTETVSWLLLFTEGNLEQHEKLQHVTHKQRLKWLGYELVRRPTRRGRVGWTWRRTKEEMEGLVGLLIEKCNRREWREVGIILERAANQPGFHGVREQSKKLQQIAVKKGYSRELPFLFYLDKISHGYKLELKD